MERELVFYGEDFGKFYLAQPPNVRAKIQYVFNLVRKEQRVPEKFLKHLTATDGLYEMRVSAGNSIYRIFCFFNAGKLVVVLNAFQKKTDKTPKNELARAIALKQEYFANRPS